MTAMVAYRRLKVEIKSHKEVIVVKHILRGLAILPILALLLVFGASPAWAADLRNGDTVVIASGDEINDDLYIAANRITINGTVNGDVLCIGDTININGKINGSVIALGSTISIDGEVTRAVRIAGANIDIAGNIGSDVIVAGDSIDLANAAKVGRDLVFAARSLNIDNSIGRSITGYAEKVDINNKVTGDVEIGVTQLTLASTAKIQGNLIYVSDNEAIIHSGAQIVGATTHNLPEAREPFYSTKFWNMPSMNVDIWSRIIAFLTTLVTGCLIILIAPKKAKAVAEAIRHKPLSSLGWGAVILFATPIAAIITFVTVIGIPVGLISLMLYGLAIYLSQIAVGLFIGYWIIGRFSKTDSRGVLVGAFALGFLILTFVKLIPFIGFALWLATVLFGIGAIMLSLKTARTDALVKASEITTTS
jgi:cytoskeletal protein CcmA (bactofilin family)